MKNLLLIIGCFVVVSVAAQDTVKKEGYKFSDVKRIETTSVKNQSRSGTCWSFAALSFFESELLRQGKPAFDLSEIWVVRHAYYDKAVKYVRMGGTINFGSGGLSHDVTGVIDRCGIVPEDAYTGLGYGTSLHKHAELDAVLEAYVKAIVTNPNKSLTTAWKAGIDGILDAYLGKRPEKFTYDGKEYTPRSFAEHVGIKTSDYVSLTSFTHHPFYSQFVLEVPDNWAWGLSYNIPLDEMIAAIDRALENGYTVLWSADVSEKGFAYKKGVAVVPELDIESMDGTEQARWVKLTEAEREAELHKLEAPAKEKTITQQMRQEAFDNQQTTDDHGMHIIGWATDQRGTKYYIVKNSWGTNQLYNGYFYASVPYVAYKTMAIGVNKAALTKDLHSKSGLK